MSGSINKVILVGRLGQDPKLAYLPSGQPCAEFSVATDESYKDREGNKVEKVEWHRVKVFGRSAEFCSNYLSKGRLVYIEGSIKTRSWDDQQGQKRYMTEVVVNAPGHMVQGLEGRQTSDGGTDASEADRQKPSEGVRNRQQQQQLGNQNSAPPRQGQFPSEASGLDDIPF